VRVRRIIIARPLIRLDHTQFFSASDRKHSSSNQSARGFFEAEKFPSLRLRRLRSASPISLSRDDDFRHELQDRRYDPGLLTAAISSGDAPNSSIVERALRPSQGHVNCPS